MILCDIFNHCNKSWLLFYLTHNLSNKRKKKTFPCTKLSQHENSKCSRSRNITAMWYRNDVIRSVLLHIHANLGMMLARDYESCQTARSTLVMIVANNVQNIRWPAQS